MSTLGDIKIRVADCQTYHFGMGVADKLAHEDAPKLVAALETVEVELRALDQVFGKDDDVIHAVITQIRQAITEALQ